jgi:hypothetical protein
VKSYATKPKRVREISLRFQPPNTITTHLHSFKIITRFSLYFPSLSQLPRLIIIFLLKKLVRANIFKIELKNKVWEKKRAPMIRVRFLKRRRRKVKVDPNLVPKRRRRRRFPCLEVNGRKRRRFPCLEANGRRRRRFPCLEANGMFRAWWPMEGERKIPFHLFPFSP